MITCVVHIKGECGECLDCKKKLPSWAKPLASEVAGIRPPPVFYRFTPEDNAEPCGENTRLYLLAKQSGY